jgi:hypothetical protein
VDEIAGEGHFSRTLVISAVNAELEKIKKEEKEKKAQVPGMKETNRHGKSAEQTDEGDEKNN